MARRSRDTRAILKIIERSGERSPLFHWMVENHDEIVAAAKGGRIRWAPFCAKAVALGLVDTRGQAPTERNARETWAQARRAVREARTELAARPPKPIYPSRMASWTPPAIVEAMAAGNPAVQAGAPASGSNPPSPNRVSGRALQVVPPKPSPSEEATDRPLSRYARPDDSPEVKAAYASIEAQLERADWYLMAGKPQRRRPE